MWIGGEGWETHSNSGVDDLVLPIDNLLQSGYYAGLDKFSFAFL